MCAKQLTRLQNTRTIYQLVKYKTLKESWLLSSVKNYTNNNYISYLDCLAP